ncbi:MAG: hypothetical protein ACRC1R_02085 [Cetobacterium sp.]|uniref:hypothetical protein n=1 Tax=Cetobacterium sp. TaxID=2071632 RepID=UPI003F3B9640
MKLKNLITFKKDLFFDGAVQADWFYSNDKSDLVAKGFVFHGPKYFGVTEKDISDKRLIDTASFVENLYERLYGPEDFNPFILAIAGYGTGKSHLSVTLGKLFSNYDNFSNVQKEIIENIKNADETIGNKLNFQNKKPNFIISINGMKDFNLNYELLKSIKKSLTLYGIDDKFLQNLTTAYSTSRIFLEKNFSREEELFIKSAKEYHLNISKDDLKDYLLNNLETEEKIFDIINNVYFEINGHKIRWDEGISADKILDILEKNLCGERGYFNKIMIIFDEFGRYLEYASDYPEKSGNSALQQIFEVIQNKENNIIFLGFIQSDLKNYLTRVDKTSNISRYIGRYDSSDKVYLSSNLETIFANLIQRGNKEDFTKYIQNNFNKNMDYYQNFHQLLLNWIPAMGGKEVWNNWEKFKTVILEGIYPFNPISIWMLSSMSEWLQNRSSLTLLHKKLMEFEDLELDENKPLKFISPINILKGDLFTELLSSEQDGRQRSQYCILYNNILKKYEDKFSQDIKDILSGNLILRILKFKTQDKSDISKALSYITDLDLNTINSGLSFLENDYGVLQYDHIAKCYDFIEDALGTRDFQIFIKRKNAETKFNPNIFTNIKFLDEVSLNEVINCGFDTSHNIITNEWNFQQRLVSIEDINKSYIIDLKNDFLNKTTTDKPKGNILWIYTNKDTSQKALDGILEYSQYLQDTPIVLFLLKDSTNEFYNLIKNYITLDELTFKEREKYSKFIQDYEVKLKETLLETLDQLKRERNLIKNNQIISLDSRLNRYLLELLNNLYPNIIPFPFDGFSAKALGKVKQYFSSIGKTILSGDEYTSIKNSPVDVKNRFQNVLIDSWQVVDKNSLKLITPKNPKILKIFEFIDQLVEEGENSLKLKIIMDKLKVSPYGFNDYMSSLIIFTYVAYRKNEIKLSLKTLTFSPNKWAEEVIGEKLIDLTKIENTTLNIIDIDLENEKINKLIKDIRANTDMALCKELKNTLNCLIKSTDLTDILQDRIENATSKLELGINAYQQYELKIHSLLSDLREKESEIDSLFRLSKRCDLLDELPHPYEYTSGQRQKFLQIKSKINELIDKNLPTWLKKVDCRRSGDVDKFQSNMKKTSTALFELGYVKESQQLNLKVENIIKNVERLRQLESLEKNIQEFKLNFNDRSDNYLEMKEQLSKIKHFESIILDNNSISQEDEDAFIKSLSGPKNILLKRTQEIDSEIENIIESMDQAVDISELLGIKNRITNILNKKLPKDQHEEFIHTLGFIDDSIYKLENFSKIDDRNKLIETYENSQDEFFDEDYGMDFSGILENTYNNKLAELDKLENQWLKEFNSINLDGTISSLTTWLNKYEVIPTYISKKTLTSIEKKKNEVLNIISKNRIDQIVSLITSLNEEDLSLLKSKLNNLL